MDENKLPKKSVMDTYSDFHIHIFRFTACLRTLLKDFVTIRDSAWRIIKSTNNMTQYTSIAIPITKMYKKERKKTARFL